MMRWLFSYPRRKACHFPARDLRHRSSKPALIFVLAVLLPGCTQDRNPTAPPISSVDLSYVTGEAAEAVNSLGHFQFPMPAAGAYPQISESEAVTLASADLGFYGKVAVGLYEKDRGGPIKLDRLKPCPRAFLAATGYEPVQPQISEFTRKVVGSYWVVSFCDGSVPQVSIAVSVHATQAGLLSKSGVVDLTKASGADFNPMGVPIGVQIPLSPEEAVTIAAKATGKRISSIPELIIPPWPASPHLARWRLALEAPVRVRGSKSRVSRSTTELFVGVFDSWRSVLLEADPSSSAERSETFFDAGSAGASTTFTLMRRTGVPRVVEPITPEAP